LISFNEALGIHQTALQVYSRRAQLIASNLANADTPNYKARDIDFRQIINSLKEGNSSSINVSFSDSDSPFNSTSMDELLYRTPNQTSLDGNTVDIQTETAAFSDNSIRFQATMQFLSGKFKGMTKALKGE